MNETQIPPMFNPAADPVDQENILREQIHNAGWFEKAGMPEYWPLSSLMTAKLVRDGGGYCASAESLEDLVRRMLIGRPGVDDAGAFEWNATDLVIVANTLEARREWREGAPEHAHKKTALQRHLEDLRATGELAAPGGMPHLDLRQLALLMVLTDDRESREIFFVGLQVELELSHGIYL